MLLRPEDLRRTLTQAVRGAAGMKVVAPRVTAKQTALGERLLADLQRGVPVRMLPTWEYLYTADALPDESSPAWTTEAHGEVSVGGGILTLVGE